MHDKNGKRLTKQQMQKPKWPEPYKKPIEIAGFKLLNYLGYRRYGTKNQGAHWYTVECLGCGSNYERYQGSLTDAMRRGNNGCRSCARKKLSQHKEESRRRELERIEQQSRLWIWLNRLMPVTSLRMREELGRSFDSENAKVMGWRTI